MTPPSLLQCENVTVRFGGVTALAGVSLAASPGDVVGLVGPLGAGKTTLLRVAAGTLRPDQGRVQFDGSPVSDLPPGEAARRGLVLVPTGGGIFPSLTVHENLELAGPGGRRHHTAELRYLLDRFPILARRPRQVAASLSGGEQRQLALARAALAQPRALLLDEPLLGLAPAVAATVTDLIRRLGQSGCAVVIAEERPSAVLSSLVGRLVGLREGKSAPAGGPEGAPAAPAVLPTARSHTSLELQALRIPLTVAEKRSLQTVATQRGETVGELLAELARHHIEDLRTQEPRQ